MTMLDLLWNREGRTLPCNLLVAAVRLSQNREQLLPCAETQLQEGSQGVEQERGHPLRGKKRQVLEPAADHVHVVQHSHWRYSG